MINRSECEKNFSRKPHITFFLAEAETIHEKTMAIVLANPMMLELKAKSVEHLRLVNTLAGLNAKTGDGM